MRYWIVLLYIYHVRSDSVKCGKSFIGEEDLRHKRQVNSIPLVYPYGATYKLLIGLTVPVPNKDKISLAFAANFQYQYVQFQNITELSQYYFIKQVAREERDAVMKKKRNERLTFYRAFANLLDSQGVDGRECVLRTICEAAQYPVEEEGLVGEMMHILLTPDYGHSEFEDADPEWEAAISQYKDAAIAGRQMFSCASIYSACFGQGVLDLITTLRDH
ncbi:uncharacterized protein LOC126370740 [Pectinophora gossypiella]|uniref:uncharacterized protein LOC126370740 n=1 Tax=Pectinophora gossypiella TaxID=13191 RepID=UPI00214EE203|nr:uncharacterized protein LOC126370740 [Pectinophora gossypiella]